MYFILKRERKTECFSGSVYTHRSAANFGIDMIPNKHRASIADTSTDLFNTNEHNSVHEC